MTTAGPLDVLVELRDGSGGRHDYAELVQRSEPLTVGHLVVQVAALQDVIESKEFAARAKDAEALPELRYLQRQRPT